MVVTGKSVARKYWMCLATLASGITMVIWKMTLVVRKCRRVMSEQRIKFWKLQKENCCENFREKLRQVLGGREELPAGLGNEGQR